MEFPQNHWSLDASAARSAAARLPVFAEAFFESGRRVVAVESSIEQLHEFRLEAKRFRYLLELFRPLFGKPLKERIAALKALQDVLGMINDCKTSAELFARWSEEPGGRRALAYFEARQRSLIAELRAEWRQRIDAPGELEKWRLVLQSPGEDASGGAGDD